MEVTPRNLLDVRKVFRMNLFMFIMLFTIGSLIAALLTEAFKKALDEQGIVYSTNFLALIMAGIVGIAGTIAAYIILGIPFDPVGIICIVFMAIAIWVGAMIGYDKVKQLLDQIAELH